MCDFWTDARIPKSFSSTTIILILKIAKDSTFVDFQLINLCNFVRRIVTELIALRLGNILHSIICDNWASIIKERNITVNILLALELANSINRKS